MPDFVADPPLLGFFSFMEEHRMTQNTDKVSKEHPAGTFNMRLGNTTYVIGVHFSKTSKETLEDKMKRLMRDDVKSSNF